jgi:hypothetical protein
MSRFLGIYRERLFSPGKVEADRAILEAVATVLRRRGHVVTVAHAEEGLRMPKPDTTVFTMSQGERALATLREWERKGIRVINSVDSILNCHRYRMVERFRRAGVAAPETVIVGGEAFHPWPAWLQSDGGWIKRGDVHATEAGDVVFVHDHAGAAAAVAGFRARRIARAVLQRHVPGVVMKFYAVGNKILAWFLAEDNQLDSHQIRELGQLAQLGARALGLEVYGGDCVITMTGALQLIDLNDWPSYAPCRAGAAENIAAHLEAHGESSDK